MEGRGGKRFKRVGRETFERTVRESKEREGWIKDSYEVVEQEKVVKE